MRIINKKTFIDLKYFSLEGHSLVSHCEEMIDEFRKNDICANHGLLADLRISAVRRTVRGKLHTLLDLKDNISMIAFITSKLKMYQFNKITIATNYKLILLGFRVNVAEIFTGFLCITINKTM